MNNNVYQTIARAQAEYARCIDDDRLEEWPNHFHGTCVYKITTAANYRDGLEAGRNDARRRGRFNPESSGRYRSADHNYDRRYGSKDEYEREYRAAFQRGYGDGFTGARL